MPKKESKVVMDYKARCELISGHVKAILEIMDEPMRPGLEETPDRVARMYMDEVYRGTDGEPLTRELDAMFPEKTSSRQMIILKDLPVKAWCIHGRTLVSTPENKPSRIAMLMRPGERLYTIVNGKLETTIIQSVSKTEYRTDLQVKVGGRLLECSLDHPMFTQRGWVSAKDLIDSDKVYIVEPKTFKRTPLQKIVDGYSLGYVLGALLSDGSVRNGLHDRGVRLGATSKKFVDCFVYHFSRAFPGQEMHLNGPYKCSAGFIEEAKMYEAWNCCNELADKVLQILGLEHKYCDNFRVPKACLRSIETMTGFIDGYIDGDGTVWQKTYASEGSSSAVGYEEMVTSKRTPLSKLPGGYLSRSIASSNKDFLKELQDLGCVGALTSAPGAYHCHILSHPQFVPNTQLTDKEVGVDTNDDYLGEFIRVEDKEECSASTRDKVLYNFECKPFPSYIANRMLSHNCEHHMIPYFGMAYVGYIPTGQLLGLSKVARLVDAAGKGFSIQERITDQIADALEAKLKPYGVIVVLQCAHTCMMVRGVEAPTSRTITSSLRGIFRDSDSARTEFLSLIGKSLQV